eukprot:12472071-Alexandrium_andersonii.AAC.1
MSASLVGSEMCIRDSLLARRLRPLRGHRARIQGGPARAPRDRRRRYSVCLLYTSDAADDM